MKRTNRLLVLAAACFAAAFIVASVSAMPASSSSGGLAPSFVAQITARLIADAIPREYERSKDWGRTRHITTGLRSSGNFFKFDIHRRKKEVNHGVWKKYRVTLVEPEKNLKVRVEELRSTGPGQFAFTLLVDAKLHGWARAKIYDHGVHLIALEAEGDTTVRLRLDANVAVESVYSGSLVPGVAIRPVVTAARLDLDDFRLKRISDLRGSAARELGDGIRHLIEDELHGSKLVKKINRSLEKRRDRLEFTPDQLLGAAR